MKHTSHLLLLFLALALLLPAASAVYDDFPYSRYIDITDPVAQDDFQHEFQLTWQPGMAADFSDIRFLQTDDTLLAYWIQPETVVSGTSATVWLRISDASQTKILCKWGKAGATSESNIGVVFPTFADDFPGSAINTTKWPARSGTYSVSGGVVTISSAGASQSYIQQPEGTIPEPGIVMYRAKSKNYGSTTIREVAYQRYVGSNVSYAAYAYDSSSVAAKYANYISGVGSSISGILGVSADTWFIQQLKVTGTESVWTVDGGNTVSKATKYFNGAGYSRFYTYGAGSELSLDWIAVRKYAATEPTLAWESLAADFTGAPTELMVGNSTVFTDASAGPAWTFNWTFGDGGNSTAQNPSHTWTAPGTYTVNLTVTAFGSSDTKSRASYVNVSWPLVRAPASITNLINATTTCNAIQFTWDDPIDPFFTGIQVYRNGVYFGNVVAGTETLTWTMLPNATSYTMSTNAYYYDAVRGWQINPNWVNYTAVTNSFCPTPSPAGTQIFVWIWQRTA